MNIEEVNPKIIEDVKDAFEKIKSAPRFSFGGICGCMYRGPQGTKCVIGHLIADSAYNVEMEGENIYNHSVNEYMQTKYNCLSDDDVLYFDKAQRYHDTIAQDTRLKPSDTVFSYENFEETRLKPTAL